MFSPSEPEPTSSTSASVPSVNFCRLAKNSSHVTNPEPSASSSSKSFVRVRGERRVLLLRVELLRQLVQPTHIEVDERGREVLLGLRRLARVAARELLEQRGRQEAVRSLKVLGRDRRVLRSELRAGAGRGGGSGH